MYWLNNAYYVNERNVVIRTLRAKWIEKGMKTALSKENC